MKSIEELIEHHKNFAETIMKKNRGFSSQIVVSVNGEIIPFLIVGDSDMVKSVLTRVEKLKNLSDWIIVMHEAYSKTDCNTKEDVRKYAGTLEERYLAGDTGIKWVLVMQVYFRNKETDKVVKKAVVYEITKETFEFNRVAEVDEFNGYLTM